MLISLISFIEVFLLKIKLSIARLSIALCWPISDVSLADTGGCCFPLSFSLPQEENKINTVAIIEILFITFSFALSGNNKRKMAGFQVFFGFGNVIG